MSRKELANAVNAYLQAKTGKVYCMDDAHIGKFECGEYHWPRLYYREAFRHILGARSDAELGFYASRKSLSDDREAASLPPEEPRRPPIPVRISLVPGKAITIVCGESTTPPDIPDPARLVIEPGIAIVLIGQSDL